MVDDSEFAVIFFVGSAYAFAIVLLYALARAWEKSLSPVARPKPTGELQATASRNSSVGTQQAADEKRSKSRGLHQHWEGPGV